MNLHELVKIGPIWPPFRRIWTP